MQAYSSETPRPMPRTRWLYVTTLGAAMLTYLSCGDPEHVNVRSNASGDPCASTLLGQCGSACFNDEDCPSGLHCAASGVCLAECSQGASLCRTPGCTERGRCTDRDTPEAAGSGGGVGLDPRFNPGGQGGNSGAATECADIALTLDDITPTVALLIDRSGSMTDYKLDGTEDDSPSDSPLRWDALKVGLLGPDSPIRALENNIRFAFAFYGNDSTPSTCPDIDFGSAFATEPPADATLWPPAFGRFAAFEDYFAELGTIPNTPTAESVTAVVKALSEVSEPGPKYLVLATDGLPDRCDDPDAHDETSRNLSVAALKAAKDSQQVGTFIIGIGLGAVEVDHLQDLANVGAGLQREQRPGAKYYEVDTQAALTAAFTEIITGVRSCRLTLDGRIDPGLADQGRVLLDGDAVPFDASNGWQVIDEQTIALTGTFCTMLKSPGEHTLEASFPCEVVLESPK